MRVWCCFPARSFRCNFTLCYEADKGFMNVVHEIVGPRNGSALRVIVQNGNRGSCPRISFDRNEPECLKSIQSSLVDSTRDSKIGQDSFLHLYGLGLSELGNMPESNSHVQNSSRKTCRSTKPRKGYWTSKILMRLFLRKSLKFQVINLHDVVSFVVHVRFLVLFFTLNHIARVAENPASGAGFSGSFNYPVLERCPRWSSTCVPQPHRRTGPDT